MSLKELAVLEATFLAFVFENSCGLAVARVIACDDMARDREPLE